jgi:hypothetical protein
MNKKLISLVMLVILTVFSVVIVSCEKDSEDNPFVGTWVSDEWQNIVFTITMNANYSFSMATSNVMENVDPDRLRGQYDVFNNTAVFKNNWGEIFTATLNGNRFTLSDSQLIQFWDEELWDWVRPPLGFTKQ